MKFYVLSLRDIKANSFHAPIYVPNIQVMLRDLQEMVNDPQGKEAWQRFPYDFELWRIAEWDNETGEHIIGQREQIIALSNLKAN